MTIALIVGFASCDPGSTINYVVVNKTAQSIKVNYQFVSNASGDTSSQETIIQADSSKNINQEQTLGYVKDYDERHDSLFIYWLTVHKGNKMTHQNFKDKKYWKFEKEDHQNATYKLIVDTTLFDK